MCYEVPYYFQAFAWVSLFKAESVDFNNASTSDFIGHDHRSGEKLWVEIPLKPSLFKNPLFVPSILNRDVLKAQKAQFRL
jgi:hypothetical protein